MAPQLTDSQRLQRLIEAALLIDREAELGDLLHELVVSATELVQAKYGALGVLARDGEHLDQFVVTGMDSDTRRAIGDLPHGGGVLGETIRYGTQRIDDLSTHPRRSGFPPHHPTITSFLGVPITIGTGHVFGNLYFGDKVDGSNFSPDDEATAALFGRIGGLLIDQAQLRDFVASQTLVEERERLARDLHDTVIQRLFGVGLSLQIALAGDLPAEVAERINNALDDLDGTIQEIRTTIFDIDQSDATADSLPQRVRALVANVQSQRGLDVTLELDEYVTEDLTDDAARDASTALREILSNVVRHSDASTVTVRLLKSEGQIVVSVHDDGVGFVPGRGPGRGLRNLSTRARHHGGHCAVETAPGRGTLVTWSIPPQRP